MSYFRLLCKHCPLRVFFSRSMNFCSIWKYLTSEHCDQELTHSSSQITALLQTPATLVFYLYNDIKGEWNRLLLALKTKPANSPPSWSLKSSTNTRFTFLRCTATAALDHNDLPYAACSFCNTRQQNLAKRRLCRTKYRSQCQLPTSPSLEVAPQSCPPVAVCDPYCSHHTQREKLI